MVSDKFQSLKILILSCTVVLGGQMPDFFQTKYFVRCLMLRDPTFFIQSSSISLPLILTTQLSADLFKKAPKPEVRRSSLTETPSRRLTVLISIVGYLYSR